MADTISRPTAEELELLAYEKRLLCWQKHYVLDTDESYAACLVKLHPSVTKEDHPALKAAIEAIPGIQEIELVVDFHTRDSVPEGRRLQVRLAACLEMPRLPESPE